MAERQFCDGLFLTANAPCHKSGNCFLVQQRMSISNVCYEKIQRRTITSLLCGKL